MTQYIDKSAVVAEIERIMAEEISFFKDCCEDELENTSSPVVYTRMEMLLSFLNTLEVKDVQEEPVSNDLDEAARKIGQKYFPNENNIWARPNYEAMAAANAFKEGAKWQEGNLWKNAQGEDLPEIDREVIVLYQPYQLEGSGECAVGFAHRPPKRWYGRNLDGEEHVFEPKTYDKGEWNIPNVVWWLDLDLPIKGGISYESNAR